MVGFVADYAVMGELNSGRNARKESKSNSFTCANGIRAFRQTFTHIMSLTFTTINDCHFTSRAQGQLIRGQNWCRVHILTHCSHRSASCGVDGSLMNQPRTEMQGCRLTFGTGCTETPNFFFCRCTSTKFWFLFIRCIVSVNSTSIAPECECASSYTWCFLEKIKRRPVNRGRIGQKNCCLWWRSQRYHVLVTVSRSLRWWGAKSDRSKRPWTGVSFFPAPLSSLPILPHSSARPAPG